MSRDSVRPRRLDAPTVARSAAVGEAEGARGAAAALACAGADADRAALLVDVGGRSPAPDPARLRPPRSDSRSGWSRTCRRRGWPPAGRSVISRSRPTPDGLAAAAAAVTVARGALAVVHLPPALLQALLADARRRGPTGVLLRADLAADRALLALVVRDLLSRGLAVAVLKQRLGWVAERRALFGSQLPTAPAACRRGWPGGLRPRKGCRPGRPRGGLGPSTGTDKAIPAVAAVRVGAPPRR